MAITIINDSEISYNQVETTQYATTSNLDDAIETLQTDLEFTNEYESVDVTVTLKYTSGYSEEPIGQSTVDVTFKGSISETRFKEIVVVYTVTDDQPPSPLDDYDSLFHTTETAALENPEYVDDNNAIDIANYDVKSSFEDVTEVVVTTEEEIIERYGHLFKYNVRDQSSNSNEFYRYFVIKTNISFKLASGTLELQNYRSEEDTEVHSEQGGGGKKTMDPMIKIQLGF